MRKALFLEFHFFALDGFRKPPNAIISPDAPA